MDEFFYSLTKRRVIRLTKENEQIARQYITKLINHELSSKYFNSRDGYLYDLNQKFLNANYGSESSERILSDMSVYIFKVFKRITTPVSDVNIFEKKLYKKFQDAYENNETFSSIEGKENPLKEAVWIAVHAFVTGIFLKPESIAMIIPHTAKTIPMWNKYLDKIDDVPMECINFFKFRNGNCKYLNIYEDGFMIDDDMIDADTESESNDNFDVKGHIIEFDNDEQNDIGAVEIINIDDNDLVKESANLDNQYHYAMNNDTEKDDHLNDDKSLMVVPVDDIPNSTSSKVEPKAASISLLDNLNKIVEASLSHAVKKSDNDSTLTKKENIEVEQKASSALDKITKAIITSSDSNSVIEVVNNSIPDRKEEIDVDKKASTALDKLAKAIATSSDHSVEEKFDSTEADSDVVTVIEDPASVSSDSNPVVEVVNNSNLDKKEDTRVEQASMALDKIAKAITVSSDSIIEVENNSVPAKKGKQKLVSIEIDGNTVNIENNNRIWEKEYPRLDKFTHCVNKVGYNVVYSGNKKMPGLIVAYIINTNNVVTHFLILDPCVIYGDTLRIITTDSEDIKNECFIPISQEGFVIKAIKNKLSKNDERAIESKIPDEFKTTDGKYSLIERVSFFGLKTGEKNGVPFDQWKVLVKNVSEAIKNYPEIRFRFLEYTNPNKFKLVADVYVPYPFATDIANESENIFAAQHGLMITVDK